jgi:hypothetical protein
VANALAVRVLVYFLFAEAVEAEAVEALQAHVSVARVQEAYI